MTGAQFSSTAWVQMSAGVFTCTAEPAAVTVGLIVGSTHVLLVDTGSCPEQGAALAQSAAAFLGRPVDRVVITHDHYDHWFGLAGVPDAQSWGQESLFNEMCSGVVPEWAPDFGFDPQLVVAPNHLIARAGAVNLGDRQVEMLHFGPAHTDGDLVVSVPDADLIFVGDLLESSGDPGFGTDMTLSGWPKALDGVLNLCTAHTLLVPGHGQPVDRDFALTQRNQIAEVFRHAEQSVCRHLSLQAALDQVDAEVASGRWSFTAETVKNGLVLAYAELGSGGRRMKLNLIPVP